MLNYYFHKYRFNLQFSILNILTQFNMLEKPLNCNYNKWFMNNYYEEVKNYDDAKEF